MSIPNYKINILQTTTIEACDWSFNVWHYKPGQKNLNVPCFSFLISGEGLPLTLVDTGVKESMADEIMGRSGMKLVHYDGEDYKNQLSRLGYTLGDVKIILHTHLHEDHAGNDDLFPNARIIFPRKELMWSVSDMFDNQYPPEYVKYFVDQLHVPGKMRLIDDIMELAPGITLEPIEGHTWGSMLIKVNTSKGLVIMCGDIIYNLEKQCLKNDLFASVNAQRAAIVDSFGDHTSGNYWNIWKDKAAIQKVMREADIVLPNHDAKILEWYGDCIE